jgi:hypothetical protein
MSSRWYNTIILLLFALAVPPKLFLWLTSAEVGFTPETAFRLAAILALVALLLVPLAWWASAARRGA